MPTPIEQQIEQLNSNIERISNEIKPLAEQANTEVKNLGQISTETRAKVDELLTEQGALQARLATAEQLVAKLEQGGGGYVGPESMGEQITASEDFQAFATNPRGTFRMPVQAAITSDGASGGDLIVPDRVPGIQTPGLPRLTLRALS